MNFRYPVFLDVAGKRCLVTSSGFEIPAKVRALVERGAHVVYVHPAAEASIEALAREGRIEWRTRSFEESDLDGCFLVITDQEENSRIFALAESRNVLCNAADDPEQCRFSFGSMVSRGDLTIAVSTNGAAPALAVRIRERLEREFGEEYAVFLAILRDFRKEIAAGSPDFNVRRELWYRLVDSEALTLLRQGREQEARQLLKAMVDAPLKSHANSQDDIE